jgi:hypothetical protein
MAHEPSPQPAPQCPWCPYTDALLKKVLQHMESSHAKQWEELALRPPVAAERTRCPAGRSPRSS